LLIVDVLIRSLLSERGNEICRRGIAILEHDFE